MEVLKELYEVVLSRKQEADEKSYTAYLFREGIDKILKKVAEESGEVIIAAKNGDTGALNYEICDLLYHLLVLMAEAGVSMETLEAELIERRAKSGNLKQMKKTDKNS